MTISVYRIHIYSEGSNSYALARSEQWIVKLDCECEDEEDARQYIKENSLRYTVLPNFLQQWKETTEKDLTQDELIEQFCFTNDLYLKHRRLFINQPDLKAIELALQYDGISIQYIK
jgi:hypothetical protein